MVDSGHEVHAFAGPASAETLQEIRRLGATFHSYPIERTGTNPVQDLVGCAVLWRRLASVKPDALIAYTAKPVIWSGAAVKLLPRPRFVALITGLGYSLRGGGSKGAFVRRVTTRLYRSALSRADRIVFQNPDDQSAFQALAIGPDVPTTVVAGSGVNTGRFPFSPLPPGPPRILMVARLLRAKGVLEFVEAAKIVKGFHPTAEFTLVGPTDSSPDGVSISEVQKWQNQGHVEYVPEQSDIRPFLNRCHLFVLPSYHEGTPRTVLEAMATGRPIVTTDAPGCRQTVVPGENGFLVQPRDAGDLAERICWLIEHRSQWPSMGEASRRRAISVFDVRRVNDDLMAALGLANRISKRVSD